MWSKSFSSYTITGNSVYKQHPPLLIPDLPLIISVKFVDSLSKFALEAEGMALA